jgi:hypothetical protein
MTIIELLKSGERITVGNRWLVWDDYTELWVVYEHAYRKKRVKIIIETESEELAVAKLIEE